MQFWSNSASICLLVLFHQLLDILDVEDKSSSKSSMKAFTLDLIGNIMVATLKKRLMVSDYIKNNTVLEAMIQWINEKKSENLEAFEKLHLLRMNSFQEKDSHFNNSLSKIEYIKLLITCRNRADNNNNIISLVDGFIKDVFSNTQQTLFNNEIIPITQSKKEMDTLLLAQSSPIFDTNLFTLAFSKLLAVAADNQGICYIKFSYFKNKSIKAFRKFDIDFAKFNEPGFSSVISLFNSSNCIRDRLMDPSSLVRDAAIDVIGKHMISNEMSVILKYYELIGNRILVLF